MSDNKMFLYQAGDGERSLLHTAAKYGQVGEEKIGDICKERKRERERETEIFRRERTKEKN
jgi:hypothetical protein